MCQEEKQALFFRFLKIFYLFAKIFATHGRFLSLRSQRRHEDGAVAAPEGLTESAKDGGDVSVVTRG